MPIFTGVYMKHDEPIGGAYASVNTRWGPVKWCCLCSRPGHYSNKCPENKIINKLPKKQNTDK